MCNRFLLSFICCMGLLSAAGQNGEFRNDCMYAKEIVVPFNYSVRGQAVEKPMFSQTVFYNYREQFSYWYKIHVKESAQLSFRVEALNDSDEYALYVYQYNQPDFCEKVYDQKVRELKAGAFTPAKSDPYDLSQRSFSVQKDNTYYISVLNTSLTNCGHVLYLNSGTDTLKVKALHLPCKREVAALNLKTFKPLDIKKDTIKRLPATLVSVVKTDTAQPLKPALAPAMKKDTATQIPTEGCTIFCSVKNAVKKTPVTARVSVYELPAHEGIELAACGTGHCTGSLVQGKTYQVKCSAFGYKSFSQTLTAAGGKNNLEILLQPYQQGENFVMKTIYFYPNTYALKKEASAELQKLLLFLRENEAIRIEIQGHTNGDNRIAPNKAYSKLGEEWNFKGTSKKLSEKRAENIRQFLLANGIPPDRIEAKGYGGKVPIIRDPQNNDEGQMNIRVEISILKS